MKKGNKKTAASSLRLKAEEIVKNMLPAKDALRSWMSETDALRLVHELEVHQIQLDLQNDELLFAQKQAGIIAEKYSALYDFAPTGYLTLSKEGNILDINLCGSQMLGKERSRLKNVRFCSFISADTKPTYNHFLENILKNKTKETSEVILSIKDKDPLYVYITGMAVENGEQIILTVVDLTKLKNTEEVVRNSLSLMEATLESIHSGILVISKQGKIIKINTRFAEMWQIPSNFLDTADDRKLWNFIAEQLTDPARFITTISETNRNHNIESVDLIYFNDGRIFERISKPMYLGNEIKGRVWSFLDITDHKKAEAEIKRINEQLINSNAEKDKFFSIIAHGLRDPFNGFWGLTQIMAEELPNLKIEKIKEMVLKMKNSAANLDLLLENLLQWARIQQGLISFNPETVRFLSIVKECLLIAQEPAKNKNIIITCNIPETLEVFADSNILQTILVNLVSNAVKFTPKGGIINLSAKAADDKRVEISIRDSGIGMSQEMVEELFRLDVQTTRKDTDGKPGTGLGLIICKDFIEKHNGTIWVRGELGKGTDVKFTLPMGSN
jgi:PAS domain S-box-containing protein